MYKACYPSRIGWIEIRGDADAIRYLQFVSEKNINYSPPHPNLEECIRQLDEYFQGKRTEFSLNLEPDGTEFQKKVWREIMKIPFGETTTYKELAIAIGNTKAARGVGRANSQNKILILIPCHRIISTRGKLTGYGGGLWRKEWLLKHEKNCLI